MIGALPSSAGAMADPVVQALMRQQQGPAEPFIWGDGGARLSPEEVARRRGVGTERMLLGSDTSPIQHWTQGLGRIADGIIGGLDVRDARRADEANMAADAQMREALTSGQVSDEMLASILMDPSANEGTRGYAGMVMQSRQPEERALTPIEKMMVARGIEPGSDVWNQNLDTALSNELDPFTNISGPNFGYSGRQSGLQAALGNMGGGGQTSGAGQGGPPPAAIEALRRGEGSPAQFDEMFGPGAAAKVLGMGGAPAPKMSANGMPTQLTREQFNAVIQAKGRAATEDWARRNNVRVVD